MQTFVMYTILVQCRTVEIHILLLTLRHMLTKFNQNKFIDCVYDHVAYQH